jgi:hypothetical protein
MASNGPIPILLLPDGVLTGRSNVVSVTSEAGAFCAPGVAGTSNYGDLLPSFTSPALATNYAYDLKIQRAGGVYSLAEWLHKSQSEGQSAWQGVDEVRYLSDPHDPFSPIGETHPAGSQTPILGAVYAKKIGKLFLYLVGPSASVVYCRYRSIGGDPNTWTLTTFNLGDQGVKSGQEAGIEVLEMPDGTLRMLVVTGLGGTADNDVSVYGSTDGLSWSLLARDVLSKAYGDQIDIVKFRAAISGDWVRMVAMDGTSGDLHTFVSSDRCASFSWLENSELSGADAPESNGHAVDEYGHVDLEGVGDATGSFVLVCRSGANTGLKARVAGRDADWSEPTVALSCVGDIFSACVVNDGTRLYYAAGTIIPGAGGHICLEAKFVPLDQALADLSAPSNAKYAQWKDAARYVPAFLTGVQTDPGYALLWGLANPDTGPGNAVNGNSALVYGCQWTARSLWKNEIENIALADEFIIRRWDAAVGPPNRTASLTSPFAFHTGASGVQSWLADRYRLGSDATGASGRIYWAYNEGGTGAWASTGAYVGWVLGALTTTLSGVSDDRCAVRIRALGTLAVGVSGATFDFSVRHGTTQIVLYDNNASVALATLNASLASKFYTVRVGLNATAGATKVDLAICSISGVSDSGSWFGALATLTSAVGATFQGYEWGHLTGQSGLSSYWRRIEHDATSDCNQYRFANPDSMRGLPVAAQPVYLRDNVYASWSGGAGFEGDSWTAEPRHTNEVENLFLPSPYAPWVGTSLTTQQIVLAADTNDATKLLDHAGLAVFGTSTHRMTIEYAPTNSWGSPAYSAAVTNDLTPALRVTGVTNGAVDVAGMTLLDGEFVGKYARTSLVGLNVCSFKVDRQVGQRLYLADSGTASATRAFSVGSSLWVHDDKFVVEHSARQQYAFARLTFPVPPGTTTATLDVRAGALVAGPTMSFPTAINWAHSEDLEPNVEMAEGFQGLRWGYEVGRPRRVFEGTIVGDVDRNRRALANQLRTLAGFSARTLVFGSDKEDLQRSAMLARYEGAVENENQGWRQHDDGTWYPIGDLVVTFSEER